MAGQPQASRSFDLLDERVRRWIWQRSWKELQDIQEQSIPAVLTGEADVLIGAGTGRGKTEAAFLPICSRLAKNEEAGLGALYVSPLKALINDQFSRLDDLCEDLEIPVHRWHGDVSSSRKRKVIDNPSGILLITPESLEALFVVRGPRIPRLFAGLQYVVVDELHAFVGTERGAQLRSQLHRIELAVRRRVPRIGLSATLGDMASAAEFLRPGRGSQVQRIKSDEGGQELRVQVRGYSCRRPERGAESQELPSSLSIADHLFETLRGRHNLIFANSRQVVEQYADRLRLRSEQLRLPREFWPHHGNLSREVREDVERALKEPARPTTAVCTSTLEMGIDIGSVASVAQLESPPSVASLRQRLGRSGRRGEPAVLRMYLSEWEVDSRTAPEDAVRSELFAATAMVNLMVDGWCEPPSAGAFHFSTLLHQVMSLIAQHGGVRPEQAWKALCSAGPFGGTDQGRFGALLRAMGAADLIVQAPDGLLLLGELGERLANHYSFFAVFHSPEEYRVQWGSKALGTLPVAFALTVGAMLIFAGRRWRIDSFDAAAKTIMVSPSAGGVPPEFRGAGAGHTHHRVRAEMLRLYESVGVPVFLDAGARELLAEGRSQYLRYGLDSSQILRSGTGTLLFPWSSDAAHQALTLVLRSRGLDASFTGVTVQVSGTLPVEVVTELEAALGSWPDDGAELTRLVKNLCREKYDDFLSEELLRDEYAVRWLDLERAHECAKAILSRDWGQ